MDPRQVLPKARDQGPSPQRFAEFAERVTGEDKSASVPDLGILHLINQIRKAEPLGKDGKKIEDDWSRMVEAELRHLKAAVKLMNEDPLMRYQFGTSLESAMLLVKFIKERASVKDVEERMDKVIGTSVSAAMPSAMIVHSPFTRVTGTM